VSQVPPEAFKASVKVSNTGRRPGATVVQLYVGRAERSSEQPITTLAEFEKVFLRPGLDLVIQLDLSLKDFAYFDEAQGSWTVDRGRYDVVRTVYGGYRECGVR
jgi:beta-glucosidase